MNFDDMQQGGAVQPVSIQLRLVGDHGHTADAVWAVPLDGGGLADALELGGQRLNDAQWRAVNRSRIVPEGGGWSLVHGNPMQVCALNGERIAPSTAVAIDDGDTLELGLLRFFVEVASQAQPDAHRPPTHDAAPEKPGGADATPTHAVADAVEFDLRDLAFASTDVDAPRPPSNAKDPFGALDIEGAEPRPDSDTLAELLGDKAVRQDPPTAHRAAAPEAWLDGAGAAHPDAALFEGLRQEFFRVVRDPTHLVGRTDWEGFVAPDRQGAPSMEGLSVLAESYPSVLDIVRQRGVIQGLIDDFDPLGREDLFEVARTEDVLRLFAPDIARDVPVAVPSLTRREHHAFSPDSHMPPTVARTDDALPPSTNSEQGHVPL